MEEERSLSDEIMSLKRSITSYKSENTKLRREVERWKSLEREACAIIDRQKEFIFSLTKENESLQEELQQYQEKPWYKKIFSK